jgi:hypothetical protein
MSALLAVLALTAESSLDENSIQYLMKNNKQTYQSNLVWESSPEINWIEGGYPVKDGANLPNSVTEDIGGFSLCPVYSKKQLRKIGRLQRRISYRYNNETPKWSSLESRRNIHESKQLLFKRAYREEAGL